MCVCTHTPRHTIVYLMKIKGKEKVKEARKWTNTQPEELQLTSHHKLSNDSEGAHFTCVCGPCAQSCLTLCDPMYCSPPGSPVHGIFPTRILEWVAIFSFKGSSWCRDWTFVSCTGRQILYHLGTREALFFLTYWKRTSDPDFQTQPKHLSKNEGKWWLFQKNNRWENCQQTCPIRRIEGSSLDRKKLNGNLDSPKEIKSSIDAKNKVNIKHLFSYFLHYEGSIFKAKK